MDQTARLRSFQELTGCNDSESRRYLDQHEWDVELAASIYFSEKAASKPPAKPPSKAASAPKKGVTGFSDFQSPQQEDDDNLKWFTGGEKSGLQVQAPKQDSSGMIQDIMQNAKQRGARNVEEEKDTAFSGSGYRLGSTSGANSLPASSTTPREVRTKITLWKNGFCVDNGPVRDYNDPTNTAFLSAIRQGIVPKELQVGPGVKDVSVELIDKRGEEFKETPQAVKPFSGSGYSLSGQKPSQSSNASNPQPSYDLSVDESQPVTTIQIRLSNGTRIVGKFNHLHTIKDIKAYINKNHSQNSNYDLATSFPQKILDENQTIQDAGILNSVLLQKPK